MTTLIQERRNRETGTIIEVWKDFDGEFGYATICQEHSQITYHDTRRLALYMAPSPLTWCEVCNGNDTLEN